MLTLRKHGAMKRSQRQSPDLFAFVAPAIPAFLQRTKAHHIGT
jgi:alpha-beta hydrolase superfamily lysophospholipase